MKTNKLLTIIFLVILAFIFSACATKDAGYTAKHDYSDEYSSGEVGGGDFGYKIEPSGLGVDDELKSLGAKNGDIVRILDHEFEYEERLY